MKSRHPYIKLPNKLFLGMYPAVCIVPTAPVRAVPSHESEMTSQLLFGEVCMVHETVGNGALRISCLHDGYEGFCMANQLMRVEDGSSSVIFKGWSNLVICSDGSAMQVPFGASFPAALEGLFHVPDRSCLGIPDIPLSSSFPLFLNTPYLWGGRSVFGADCSGFTQMVMKAMGEKLPRDASQQAELGSEIRLDEVKLGDLAFFDQGGRVVHVGICLEGGGIIHAYGKVRKDSLDGRGIYDPLTGVYSHSLYALKRLL